MCAKKVQMQNENEAFARLQELMDALPSMEKKGARLAKALAAREALAKVRYRDGQAAEAARIRTRVEEAKCSLEAAKADADADDEVRVRGLVLALSNQLAIREGAAFDASRQAESALAAGRFATEADAWAARLGDDEFAALESEVEEFKAEYAATLEACRAIYPED